MVLTPGLDPCPRCGAHPLILEAAPATTGRVTGIAVCQACKAPFEDLLKMPYQTGLVRPAAGDIVAVCDTDDDGLPGEIVDVFVATEETSTEYDQDPEGYVVLMRKPQVDASLASWRRMKR